MNSTDPHLRICVNCTSTNCNTPDLHNFTPTEFEQFITKESFRCRSCGQEMAANGYCFQCCRCKKQFKSKSLSQMPTLLNQRCESCVSLQEWNSGIRSIFLVGSWAMEYASLNSNELQKVGDELMRKGRSDYWEGLVHFCSAQEFVSIYRDRRIKAASTGLYYKLHPAETLAVCLTESTIPNWQEIKNTHGDYGFVFRKSDIIRIGGAPVISLPHSVIEKMKLNREKIPKTLWPYLTKLLLPTSTSKKKIDYLHEREWRVPNDVSFDAVKPFAVVIAKEQPRDVDHELILQAAREFQEISERQEITIDDVSEAIKKVPHVDYSKVVDESEIVHTWLLRNGIRTREALAAFVASAAIFDFLAKVYVEELRRPAKMPLDPTAIGTWGAVLYVNGLRDDNKEFVIEQIRQTPEYKSAHKLDRNSD